MSKPSSQHPYLMGGPPLSARVAYEEWQRHVDAGRIGGSCRPAGRPDGPSSTPLHEAKRPSTTPAQLVRHMRNEEALLGRAVSVTVHVREDLRGR